jgi:Protein of unknown function (DUF992)
MGHHGSYVRRSLALAGACAWAGVCGAAQVPPKAPDDRVTELGTLTCSLIGATSPTGRDVLCEFHPGQQGPVETYVGSAQAIGQTKLLFGRGAVILAVKGPASTNLSSGLLTQRYAVDAAASGNGLAPLVGERNKSIMLQPLAEEDGRVASGKSQAEAVLMVVELELQASPA